MKQQLVKGQPKLVIFDAGGVLVTPPFAQHQGLVGSRLLMDEVRRIFYATYAETSMPLEGHLVDFWSKYAERLGLTDNPFAGYNTESSPLMRWNQPTDQAAQVMAQIKAVGTAVAVISNAAGDVALLLEEAGVCSTGPNGRGTQIDFIFDSGDSALYPNELISRKPNSLMFEDAFAMFDVEPSEALFVGDAMWSDGGAAQKAGVPFLHLDPFGDCVDTVLADRKIILRTKDHAHVTNLSELLPVALGAEPRLTIVGGELPEHRI